ncbi:MAG: prepilin-type N-terminal cleavage/methylation domain-containing protein [bacterium]|nr:prepilin-type N-terminal cleavage/methylation domain-containing protein [bacterium]
MSRERGMTLVELLVAAALAGLVLGMLALAMGGAARLLVVLGARVEAEDTAVIATEAFAFDVRRAGFDPAAAGIEALAGAAPDRLVLQADLDGDGLLNASSAEVTRWQCLTGPPRLNRVIGAQSLPLAADVRACRFRFLDASGNQIVAPAAGLPAADRARVRALVLEPALPGGLAALAARRALSRCGRRQRPGRAHCPAPGVAQTDSRRAARRRAARRAGRRRRRALPPGRRWLTSCTPRRCSPATAALPRARW